MVNARYPLLYEQPLRRTGPAALVRFTERQLDDLTAAAKEAGVSRSHFIRTGALMYLQAERMNSARRALNEQPRVHRGEQPSLSTPDPEKQ